MNEVYIIETKCAYKDSDNMWRMVPDQGSLPALTTDRNRGDELYNNKRNMWLKECGYKLTEEHINGVSDDRRAIRRCKMHNDDQDLRVEVTLYKDYLI